MAMGEERMAKRSSFGKSIRTRLSDITNYEPQHKCPPLFDQTLPLDSLSSSDKEQIDTLLKENAGLMKVITEKNIVIEMKGIELQKTRIGLQKTQLQNWNLAQSNSHMMAELNLGKKKLKELQHQLACKEALLKTMHFEPQVKCEMSKKCESKMKDGENTPTNLKNASRHTRPVRSRSIGTVEISEKKIVENKRRCVRRQSANENMFEIKDLRMHDGPTLKVTEQVYDECDSKPKPQDSQRMSFGRPSRRAAEKVQSYKEIPLNIKMRRPQ